MSLKRRSLNRLSYHSNNKQKIQKEILSWYDSFGRHDLPWQNRPIYEIWISEIMLQQTQVKTVKLFFRKFKGLKLISIGRLKLSHKNHDGLIREFFKIKDLFDANLFIIGEGADRSYLKNLIRDLEMQDRVFLMGSKNQKWIQKNLHDYDLFVQSSHYEGFGITAIEAAAACIPLILSKVDGHIEISENGDFCDLYENKNQGELSEKILDFYKNPKIKFREASDNLLYYKKKFDLENLNQNLMKIYKSI